MTDEGFVEAVEADRRFWLSWEDHQDRLDKAFDERRHWPCEWRRAPVGELVEVTPDA